VRLGTLTLVPFFVLAGCSETKTATDHCLSLSPGVLQGKFEETLRESYRNQGVTLREGWAVKSKDRKNIYYVSAELDGPGLEADGHILTWATNNLDEFGGMTFSVDDPTIEFSTWGDGRQTRAELGGMDHGVSESRDCVRDR
jgi:hypothetical protein